MTFHSQLLKTMSVKETVQVELPVLWGESLGIRIPFSFIQKSHLLSTFLGKLPTDDQTSISSGHPSERINLFLYVRRISCIFKNKPNPKQSDTYTHTKISETSGLLGNR